jgi:hypothetical protein
MRSKNLENVIDVLLTGSKENFSIISRQVTALKPVMGEHGKVWVRLGETLPVIVGAALPRSRCDGGT